MSKKQSPPNNIQKISTGAQHGGAWKVAYADFVTAMMAFFMLMWMLNMSTEEQITGIANFFDPSTTRISQKESGAGGVLGGLSMAPKGSMATNLQPVQGPPPTIERPTEMVKNPALDGQPIKPEASNGDGKENNKGKGEEEKPAEEKIVKAAPSKLEKAKEELKKQEQKRFDEAEQKIKQAIKENPELAQLAENLIIDSTPEGLRIQVVDNEGASMFASGSAKMFAKTENLMSQMVTIIKDLPNEISIAGHTDNIPYGAGADYTNWELSADRANSSRRVLAEAGFPAERINNVLGKADTEPLLKDDPANARNRRISITLLREELTDPDYEEKAKEAAGIQEEEAPAEEIEELPAEMEEVDEDVIDESTTPSQNTTQPPIGTFQRTPGAVEFP